MQSFDDFDDLFQQMRRDQMAADARVKPWQAAIKSGEFVYRRGPGFYIYSEILPDPEPKEERLRHYRFTKSYSMACEHGELGDIHVSTVEGKLSADEFKVAESHRWEYVPATHFEFQMELRRIAQLKRINAESIERHELESKYEQVWNTRELERDFEVIGFLAPYCIVKRKSDGQEGSLEFQHNPRFYFNFDADES